MQINVRKRWAVVALAVALVGCGGAVALAADPGPTDAEAATAVDLLDRYVQNRPTVTQTVTETVTAPAQTVTQTVTVTPSPSGSESPSPTPTTSSPSPTPTSPSPTVAIKRWHSGAGLDLGNNVPVAFGTWRGEATGALGGWDDSKDAQQNIWTLDVGVMKNWNGVMDIAVGAIYSGESWSSAANGAYDARWTTALTKMKQKLGTRDPNLVNIRFAHEMNGNWVQWRVPVGQEADFRAALTRFSNLRYQAFGAASAAPQVVLCANDGTSSGMADPRNLFVGKDASNRQVTDVYCVDSYNSWPHRTNYADIRASQDRVGANGIPIGVNAHRKFAESVGVPFSIGEWGNCGTPNSGCDGGGGESPAYMKAMNDFFRENAGDPANPKPGQVIYELYFDLWSQYTLYSNGSNMNQPQSAAAYRDLVWGQ